LLVHERTGLFLLGVAERVEALSEEPLGGGSAPAGREAESIAATAG